MVGSSRARGADPFGSRCGRVYPTSNRKAPARYAPLDGTRAIRRLNQDNMKLCVYCTGKEVAGMHWCIVGDGSLAESHLRCGPANHLPAAG